MERQPIFPPNLIQSTDPIMSNPGLFEKSLWRQMDHHQQLQLAKRIAELIQRIRKDSHYLEKNHYECR